MRCVDCVACTMFNGIEIRSPGGLGLAWSGGYDVGVSVCVTMSGGIADDTSGCVVVEGTDFAEV